jgi:hypothetical protein
LAAVSNPTKSSTPYSTPKKMPAQPSADEEGLNGLTLFAEPSLTITVMKNTVTTMIETSASTSWLRVEIRTPKYSAAVISTMTISVQAQEGSGFTLNSEAMVDCR